MSDNGISTLATKELRQVAKLNLAATDRATDGNPRASYDITQLPTQYSDNDIVDNPNTDGLIVGRPWIEIPPTPTYTLEFRAVIGEGELGDTITTCNEGDVIWFGIIGTNVPDDPTAYLQFSGANITNADVAVWSEVPINLVDPIPYNFTGTNTNGAPILIEADNLTEGNETLTLSWIVNSTTVATTSITLVDTSTSPSMTPEQLITNSDFSGGTTGWTASGGFGTYSYTAGSQIAINPDGYPQFSYGSRTLSRNVTVSSVTADASTFTAVVNLRHDDKVTGGYTQIDTYNFTVVYKNSSGGTVITKTTGTSNAPQNFTDITLTLNRSEISATFDTITSAAITLTGIDTGSWAGQHGPVVRYITLTAS